MAMEVPSLVLGVRGGCIVSVAGTNPLTRNVLSRSSLSFMMDRCSCTGTDILPDWLRSVGIVSGLDTG